MSVNDIAIGERWQWGGEVPFGISGADRHRHLYLVGQTGTGKSTLLRRLIAQDIEANQGLALLDPHGDLAEELLCHIPRRRIDDVVIVDPSDHEHPVAFNPFYRVPPDEQPLVAANTISAFKHVWSDSWGPRLEYILYNAVAALLAAPDNMRPSFIGVARILVDKPYREQILRHVTDGRVVSFWHGEFDTWNDRQVAEALSSVQNKIGQVLSNPFVRNIIGQWRPTVDLDALMAKKRILIVRLPKGAMGTEPAHLLGALLVSGLLQSAMRREAVADRAPFHMYVDEFQNFTSDAFATILSEARKYGLTLTIGHQYLAQMPPSIREAVFGNVGNILSFRVGAADADELASQFGTVPAHAFRDLERGEVVVRLTQGGSSMPSFTGQVAPLSLPPGSPDKVRAKSRRAFARPRKDVEQRIGRWLAV